LPRRCQDERRYARSRGDLGTLGVDRPSRRTDRSGRDAARDEARRPRAPQSHLWVAGLTAALALVGCGSVAFDWTGPEERAGEPVEAVPSGPLTRALPAPELEVRPARPLIGWLAPVTVVAHTPSPARRGYHLVLETSEGERVEIHYALDGTRALPVKPGEALAVRYFGPDSPALPPTVGTGPPALRPKPSALVVASPTGQAIAIVTLRGGLPPGILPGGAEIQRADTPDHLAYTEVRRLPSLCLARIEHADLGLATEDATVWVSPGALRRVSLAATPFDLIAFDASRLTDERCAADDPTHTSWVLLALDAATHAPSAPPPSPP